jgi:glycosyltransferase involved in cell wall biosynthesis
VVIGLLSGSPDVQVVEGAGDVNLCLDGRFRAGRRRTVTAVLDLGHLLQRTGYRPGEWLVQNWRVASAARRSDHLLAPSETVRYGLERYLGVPPERITVVPALPDARFRRPSREQVEELRRELGLPERYFVFVGTRSRRKNLDLLARAWQRAAERLGAGTGLVLAGPGRGGVPGARALGYVEPERLPALIGGAIAWLNPSLYEGSPVGALEAMACGAPPLVAATGAQPHAVNLAGLILDPHDPGQWATALATVAADADLRGRLSVAGLKAAAELRASSCPGPEALLAALSPAPGEGA